MRKFTFSSSLLLLMAIFIATSCSKKGADTILANNASIIFTLDADRIISDAGGEEIFHKLLRGDAKKYYQSIDKSVPVLLSIGGTNSASMVATFSTVDEENRDLLINGIKSEVGLVDLSDVAGYKVCADKANFVIAYRDNNVVIIALTNNQERDLKGIELANHIAGGSLEALLNGTNELKYLTANDVKSVIKNDLGVAINYAGLSEMSKVMGQNLDMSMFDMGDNAMMIGSLNFEAGEIVLSSEILNYNNEYIGEVNDKLFNKLPEAYGKAIVGFEIKNTAKIAELIESIFKSQMRLSVEQYAEITPVFEKVKQWIQAFGGQFLVGGVATNDIPDFIAAAEVNDKSIDTLITRDLGKLKSATDNPKVSKLEFGRSGTIYYTIEEGKLVISNNQKNLTEKISKDISSSEGAKYILGSYGAVFLDIDGTIETLPKEMRSIAGLAPVVGKLDNFEIKNTKPTKSSVKLTFKDKKTNALKVIVDELSSKL